jgi:LuxR family transcriptional regulator, maltose regulon positive regulatory protein
VERPRLPALMDIGAETTLTLVSAPAGFGKTTVLASWLARPSAGPRIVAFVSLDESDSNAGSFWLYVVTALHAAAPGVGAGALPLLAAGQPATRTMLAAVLNEIGAQSAAVDLILDDYHLADSPEVADGMTFLLDRRPPNLHVVISTRADPNLPLARLRARGELVELRARDLRFTGDETASYLTDVGGLPVAPDEVSALESRTEGWAAALQLVSLSMQGRDDIGAFIEGFAGTDRYVVDYLADEVLSRQSDEVRDFLERTSILAPLGGDLCDRVLERTGSQAMLEGLDRANLFLVPLDDHRSWYRYHHLFADVLQARLRSERPDLVPGLHLRASRWYEEGGDPVSAVRHALAAGDVDRAADLIEAATPTLQRDRKEATLRRWLDDMPDAVVQPRPVLAIAFVGALMSSNEFSDVDRRLRDIERQLPAIHALLDAGDKAGAPDGSVVALDLAELARVPGAIELYRTGLCLVSGDLSGTHDHARRAIDAAAPDDDVVRAGAAGLSGLAHWASGELEEALHAYAVCIDGLRRAQHISDALGCYLTVAEIQMAQGRLRDVQDTYDEAVRVAASTPDKALRGMADVYVGQAQLALERGDLETARERLAAAHLLGEDRGLPPYAYRSRAAGATLSEAEGDLAGALELVRQAQQVYLGDFSPNVRPLHAVGARLQIRLGDLDAVGQWARDHDVEASQELSYLREFEHITLAEAMVARGRSLPDPALLVDTEHLLSRLLDAATAGGRGASMIEVLILQASTAQARGDESASLALLDRAVRLAEPEGQKRAFARWGAPVADIAAGAAALEPAASSSLPDPLSAREIEVLRLLATDLDGPEIAKRLFVSLNTLRTHTKNIYAKLGVNSRRAAVRRGTDLGLLTGR